MPPNLKSSAAFSASGRSRPGMKCKPGLRQYEIYYNHRAKTRLYEISQAGCCAECNTSEAGAEELQKNRGIHDRAEFTSRNHATRKQSPGISPFAQLLGRGNQESQVPSPQTPLPPSLFSVFRLAETGNNIRCRAGHGWQRKACCVPQQPKIGPTTCKPSDGSTNRANLVAADEPSHRPNRASSMPSGDQ